jgi:signal transduction histidine kinase
MARELERITQQDLANREREMAASEERARVWLLRLFAVIFGLGVLVAGSSLLRMWRLEKRAAHERRRIEQAEAELRRLSQQLVRTQEEERRALSRELHDQVGQMLTALRVEMGNIERLRSGSDDAFRKHLRGVKQLAEESLRTVRDMAMGLRPSMLDDLGLGPALEWQAREYSRRHGVPVNVRLEGAIDTLPDGHRTCVFRVVQEALTNVARHAAASEIRVAVHCARDRAFLTVQDNGAGFDIVTSHGKGLGLLGIQERVRGLGGTVTWTSQPNRGTMLSAEIPVPQTENTPMEVLA